MEWGSVGIRDIHGDLRNAIFFNIPANGFYAFQRAGLTNWFSSCVFHRLASVGIIEHPAFFPHIKGY